MSADNAGAFPSQLPSMQPHRLPWHISKCWRHRRRFASASSHTPVNATAEGNKRITIEVFPMPRPYLHSACAPRTPVPHSLPVNANHTDTNVNVNANVPSPWIVRNPFRVTAKTLPSQGPKQFIVNVSHANWIFCCTFSTLLLAWARLQIVLFVLLPGKQDNLYLTSTVWGHCLSPSCDFEIINIKTFSECIIRIEEVALGECLA